MEDTNDRITLVGGNQNAHAFSVWAGLQNPDVRSGPIALELWLYNNPLFTYTAEAVKTANRFFNGRQLKHPCRARAPSPRQERRRVKSAPWLLSSSELRWHEYGVCHYSNKMGPIFSVAGFLPHATFPLSLNWHAYGAGGKRITVKHFVRKVSIYSSQDRWAML